MPDSSERPKEKGWAHLVAGSAAGCSAVLLLHPFDVIKTRLQVQDGTPGHLPTYRGTLHAVRAIISTEGWRGMYAGLTPSLIGSTVSWGAYLYLYEEIKSWHRNRKQVHSKEGDRLTASWNLISAAEAGAMVCCVTNPIWLIKTRLALQQHPVPSSAAAARLSSQHTTAPTAAGPATSAGRAYKGVIDAFATIGRTEGLRGYYKGFGPSLVLQTAHGAIQFAVYEELKHQVAAAGGTSSSDQPGPPDRQLTPAEVSVCGAGSKLVASIATYPVQVIRSRLQQRTEGRQLVYRNSWQAVAVAWQREGFRGFYKGLAPSLLRTMPQSAVTLTVYEWMVTVLEGRQA